MLGNQQIIKRPSKNQHLVKIKTVRPETSYAVLPTRTRRVKYYGYITVFWRKLRNTTYVVVRHVRIHSISQKCWKVHTTIHSKKNV